MALTERQKIRHLTRRLAFGSTLDELAEFESIGLHKTIDRLIDYDKTPDPFPVSPWEFVMGEKDQVNLDANRAAAWWALRMACTKRPSQEKLALFWHNHFAVSASKVENHPMMLQHLQTLRSHANSSFRTLLGETTRDPAMLRWLDTDTSVLGKPNENFAREVLELFTVGIGNYTEKDVQELARAFTGWSNRSLYRGGAGPGIKQFLSESVAMGRPIVASSYSQGFHDGGVKTILGKTGRFDTESALDMLAGHPNTARHVTGKLWAYYAYSNPEPKVHERMIRSFQDSKGDLKTILLTLATTKEFWSERCIRAAIKSPADLIVPLVRQLKIGEAVVANHKPQSEMTMMAMGQAPPATLQAAELIYGLMRRMGMRLLYPPDVAGWEWGAAWVSPAMMAERMRINGVLINRGRSAALAEYIRKQIDAAGATSTEALVHRILEMFDADLPPEKREIVVQAAERGGGVAAMAKNATALPVLSNVFRLIFGSPEFQMH